MPQKKKDKKNADSNPVNCFFFYLNNLYKTITTV